ncbi:hypothetical protein [Cohnella abietis]|uniref:Uncharacterized protein n=1 Tax=Cohnella abietis TaxID=2507935 RepID=A0A3T1D2X8_9BACL|nr:hypothetical protein [Cohnella abietis]BBI32462.1 hypothetical protein KCTCHS21_18610 [Cohnella abietis]
MSVETVLMKCVNSECGDTWKTGNIKLSEHEYQLIDPNCDKCGTSGFIEEFLKVIEETPMNEIKRLVEEAKSIYSAWNWDMIEAEMGSSHDRGAFRELVTMYTKMVKHIESPSNQGEATRLREALTEVFNLLEEHQPDWYLGGHYRRMKAALSSHTEDTGIQKVRTTDEGEVAEYIMDSLKKNGFNGTTLEMIDLDEEPIDRLYAGRITIVFDFPDPNAIPGINTEEGQ